MRIEKGKKYETLGGDVYDLGELDPEELKFLRHLEQRSQLAGMDYVTFMQGVTVWNHPVWKGRKPAEIANCAVYHIAEDLGFRLAIDTKEMPPWTGKETSEKEALDMMKPQGLGSRVVHKIAKVKARMKKDEGVDSGRNK